MASKLLQATIDPNRYETTLTVTGAGGFGKTTTVISLCYHPVVNKHFTNGFVFIELGPQATDPSIKLCRLYHLLTGEHLQQGDISHATSEVQELISYYYRNLLIIIDDVWYVEDAEPLVKAFLNCKTILTTRLNDIEHFIPSKQSVVIGPMTRYEAFTLLNSGVINSSELSQEDVSLLDELAQDVHLWPLLLSLIKGQLSHNLKQYHFSYHEAIQDVQAKLHHKGLTAFDRNNIQVVNKSRKVAVKACIEITLELLTKSLSEKLKILILCTGIGTSLETGVLNILWNISKQEAKETVDALWAYGLVQFTDVTVSSNSKSQLLCVEVYEFISRYITECMDTWEVITLSPSGRLNILGSVVDGITVSFQQSYGVDGLLNSLTVRDYLKYKLSELERLHLPLCYQAISRSIITDPHIVIVMLRLVKDALMASPHAINLLSLFDKETNILISNCKDVIRNSYKLCRQLIQRVQRNTFETNHEELLQTVEEFIKCYPSHQIALRAVTTVKKIIPYCDGELRQYMSRTCERLMMLTCDYHDMTLSLLPHIKLYIKLHKQITGSLLNRSPGNEVTYRYIMSGKFSDEIDLISIKKSLKLKEVASSLVSMMSLSCFM